MKNWHLFLAVLVSVIVLSIPYWILSSSSVQHWILDRVAQGRGWNGSWQKVSVSPLNLSVSLEKVYWEKPKEGHHVFVDHISLNISFWRLLRGQIAIEEFRVVRPKIILGKFPKREAPSKEKVSLKNLVFLKNLVVQGAFFEDGLLQLPSGKSVAWKDIHLKLDQAFSGENRLSIQCSDIEVQGRGGVLFQSGQVSFFFETDPARWSSHSPYLNHLAGSFWMEGARLPRWDIPRVEGELAWEDSQVRLTSLNIGNQKTLQTAITANLLNEEFSGEIQIQEPLHLPDFGNEKGLFHTAGDLTGKIQFKGVHWKPETAQGEMNVSLQHIWDVSPGFPATLNALFQWENGKLSVKEAEVKTEEVGIPIRGGISLAPFAFDLGFQATQFPLERFFEKFKQKSLQGIRGFGTAEGHLTGGIPDVHFVLSGKAEKGAYRQLSISGASVVMDVTQKKMDLKGDLLNEKGKKTGEVDLQMSFGEKKQDGTRSKTMRLSGSVVKHPFGTVLPQYKSGGDLSGNISLEGTPEHPVGQGEVSLDEGSFYDQPISISKAIFQLKGKELHISEAQFKMEEASSLSLQEPIRLSFFEERMDISGRPVPGFLFEGAYRYNEKQWDIRKFSIKNQFFVEGSFQTEGTVRLNTKGKLSLGDLHWLKTVFRDVSGEIQGNLNLHGSWKNPFVEGELYLHEATLSPRFINFPLERLEGRLFFQKQRVKTEKLTGGTGAGTFVLSGSMVWEGLMPTRYDLAMKGEQLYYRNPSGNFRMEYDCDLTLKGSRTNSLLKGDFTLLDGKYNKNFSLIDEFAGEKASKENESGLRSEFPPVGLDLHVRNTGDLWVDNNVGKIGLKADLLVKGNSHLPKIVGGVEVVEGDVHYLGFNFEITRGFMEFRDPYDNPYLEIQAEREIQTYHVLLSLRGRTNNLALDLSGNSKEGPIEKRDVISLILFGVTAEERRTQNGLQNQLGTALAAEQLSLVVERPVSRYAHLDIFRLETDPNAEGRISRFHIGKQLTDRLTMEFLTGVNSEDAVQTFRSEYWLLDNFLFKVQRNASQTSEDYELTLGVRFQSR